MSSTGKQTVLITGATRGTLHSFSFSISFPIPGFSLTTALGIGLGLTTAYLLRPYHTVIAAVRDPLSSSAQSLASLSKDESSTLLVVKIDSASLTDASRAAHDLETSYHISRIDTVIANAGTMGATDKPLAEEPLREVDVRKVEEFFKVNALGVLVLFQGMRKLLMRGGEGKGGKFVSMGSPVGSLGIMDRTSPLMGAYGCSKAAAHYLVKKIAMEEGEGENGVCAFVVDPG